MAKIFGTLESGGSGVLSHDELKAMLYRKSGNRP